MKKGFSLFPMTLFFCAVLISLTFIYTFNNTIANKKFLVEKLSKAGISKEFKCIITDAVEPYTSGKIRFLNRTSKEEVLEILGEFNKDENLDKYINSILEKVFEITDFNDMHEFIKISLRENLDQIIKKDYSAISEVAEIEIDSFINNVSSKLNSQVDSILEDFSKLNLSSEKNSKLDNAFDGAMSGNISTVGDDSSVEISKVPNEKTENNASNSLKNPIPIIIQKVNSLKTIVTIVMVIIALLLIFFNKPRSIVSGIVFLSIGIIFSGVIIKILSGVISNLDINTIANGSKNSEIIKMLNDIIKDISKYINVISAKYIYAGIIIFVAILILKIVCNVGDNGGRGNKKVFKNFYRNLRANYADGPIKKD